jgi:putative membrane protein
MRGHIYSRFDKANLTLNDELAIDRTLLANERTLLAYLRSGVALLIAGATIMHFAHAGWFWVIGLICIPTGIVTAAIGTARYWQMSKSINLVRNQSGVASNTPSEDAGP